MSFKRVLIPSKLLTGDKLTPDLVGIGFRQAANLPTEEPNLEDTLLAASIEGMQYEDLRVLALLVDWLSIHLGRVNVDRLTKLVGAQKNKSVKAFWAAIADWQSQDPRMKKLRRVFSGKRCSLLGERGDFLLQRDGEDERFVGSVLLVPGKVLRHRPQDILSPAELAKRHSAYGWRVLIGPSYRADMWALMEREPKLSPSELARRTYGSFPTAWGVQRDWALLHSNSRLAAAY